MPQNHVRRRQGALSPLELSCRLRHRPFEYSYRTWPIVAARFTGTYRKAPAAVSAQVTLAPLDRSLWAIARDAAE
jgi:hypothetical protein